MLLILYKVEDIFKNNVFYDELKCEWDMHRVGDLIMCFGDFNGLLVGILMNSMGLMEDMV